MLISDKYLKNTLKKIMSSGTWDKNPRPKWSDGIPAHSKFISHTVETYNIDKGEYPIPTIRPTAVKSGIREILWIYQKTSNSLKLAKEMGINWWDDFNVGDGTIGVAYGEVVRRHNLIEKLLYVMKNNPFSRRHLLNIYQETESIEQDLLKGLNPCFYSTTWTVLEVGNIRHVDVLLNSRSSDYIVAGFINRTQYVALAQMVCSHLSVVTGIKNIVGKFTVVTANSHLYDRHITSAKELVKREGTDEQGVFYLKTDKLFQDITIDDWEIKLPKTQPLSQKLEIAV